MSDFVFHAGLPKTGTSTLQRSIFQRHSQVFYLGKVSPSEIPRGCVSERAYAVLAPLLWQLDREFDVEEHRVRFQGLVEQPAARDKLVVGSWEAVGNASTRDFTKCLKRLQAGCGEYKLLLTLRNPLVWLPALYLHHTKGQFFKKHRPVFEDRCFLEFGEWMRRHEVEARGMSRWLCYARNIEQAVTLLGQDRVCVVLFEDLVQDPDAYYASVAGFLNIDERESVELARGAHHNKRLLQSELEYIQAIDSSAFKRFKWGHSSPRGRRKRLRAYVNASDETGVPARVQLDEQQREKVTRATAEGHHWLVEQLGLRLKQHGYPL